jgi:hypothetical protein
MEKIMALLGQASGSWLESSSSLRILHMGIRNSTGMYAASAFTQTNPPTPASQPQPECRGFNSAVMGVLSGSVCFAQSTPKGSDTASGAVGGPTNGLAVLGVFINHASGNSFENTPGLASGIGPYASGQGTYANSLFETHDTDAGNDDNRGASLTYAVGSNLVASQSGYLTASTASHVHAVAGGTVIGVCRVAPDARFDELVYDQRI